MAKSIIVLWLREEDLRKFPLRKISELKAFLKVQQDQKIKIIGPYSSDMLHDMVNEACPFIVVPPQEKCGTTSKQDSRPDLTNVRFYSYGASAPDSQLLGNLNGTVQGYFDKFDTRILQRTIANDDTLARGIVSELKRRQVDPGHRAADHVALISEWDTFYGQTLPQAVEREFSPRPRPGWHCQHRHGLDPPCIHKFTYLRGLDGLLPSAESKEDTKQDKATPQGEQQAGAAGFFKTQPDANNLDRPVGQGQFDYLRRMSKDLHKTDEELRKEGRKLKVVGILGSDVFDKLLILRALRPEFPEALFFITDFDEAFSIESELPWTRNLIISSSFGPILNKTIQREIPSFRDSYQTSTFLATLLAIGDPANKWETPEIVSKSLAEQLSFPRIFEIERKGDVLSFNKVPPVAPAPQNHEQKQEECPTNSGDCKAKIAGPLIQGLSLAEGGAQGVTPDCGKSTHPWYCDGIQIQPPVEKLFPTFEEGTRTKLAAGLALLAVLVWVALHFRKVPEGALVEVWLVVLGFGLAFWERLARRLTENGEGEPIALLQGVSVWPTVLLRVFGILLSVYFLPSSTQSSEQSCRNC